MSENKVTIVIPTFNRAKYVVNTIESALAQTVPCDIIVCDHGSSDNTPEVLKQYEGRVKYIRREKDFGPHFCWLEGILNADTEFIHLHFDDDLMDSTFVEKTLALMSDDVGVVFTDATRFSPDTNEIYTDALFQFDKKWKTGVMDSSVLENELLYNYLMLSPAICLYRKKDIIDAILPGNLPVDFGGNYHGVGSDLLMSLLACIRYPKCAVVTESLTAFGCHKGSITIDAEGDPEKFKRLQNGYDAFKNYYRLIKLFKTSYETRKRVFNKKFTLGRRLRMILNALGLMKDEV